MMSQIRVLLERKTKLGDTMAKGNKKRPSKKGSIKDAIKLTVEPPPKAITPPQETEKKANKKK